MAKTLYQNKNGTLEPISWMPFVSTTEAELEGKTYPEGTIIHVTDGEEDSIITETYTLSKTVPASDYTTVDANITKNGYIPICISSIRSKGQGYPWTYLHAWYFSAENTLTLGITNTKGSAYNAQYDVVVMYKRK